MTTPRVRYWTEDFLEVQPEDFAPGAFEYVTVDHDRRRWCAKVISRSEGYGA